MSIDTSRLDWIEDLAGSGMAVKISKNYDGRICYSVDGVVFVRSTLRECIDADVLESACGMVAP
jgi:hypothetical protein